MALARQDLSYPKWQNIVLDAPGANQTDFPFLLVINDARAIANADMASKRYRIYDWNGTLLSYEEDYYAEGASYVNAHIWVKVSPVASPTGDENTIQIAYGNYDPGSDQDNSTDVWSHGFLAVWHLNDLTDATGNGNTLGAFNTPSVVAGKIGNCYSFNDSLQQYLRRAAAVFVDAPATITCLFKSDDATIDQGLLGVAHESDGEVFYIRAAGNLAGDPVRLGEFTAGAGRYVNTTSGFSADTWHHAAGVFASTTSRSVYLDGGSKGTNTQSIGTTPNPLSTQLAYSKAPGQSTVYLSGLLDECRMANTARSDAWIAYESSNVLDADNAQTWQGEQSAPAAAGALRRPFAHAFAAPSVWGPV